MAKKHLKRVAAPRTWNIERKLTKFITRPTPSGHRMDMGIPLQVLLKEYLKYVRTSKEAKNILASRQVLIDGKAGTDARRLVGLMDVVSFPKLNETYRLVMNNRGRLVLVKSSEAQQKPCRIERKTAVKDSRIQLGLHDGTSIITEKKEYKTGDTLVLQLPERSIQHHLPLQRGMLAYLTGGSHIGRVAAVEQVAEDKIIATLDGRKIETPKRFAFVVGREKPVVNLNA